MREMDGYKVVFDRFFTSLSLLIELAEKGVMDCGTILSNRKGQPTMAKEKDLPRGHYEGRINQLKGLSLYIWKDVGKKLVRVASNFHGTELAPVERRKRETGPGLKKTF